MDSVPPLLADLLKALTGALVTVIIYLVKSYRERKKSDLENEEAEARTELTRINARSVEFRDNLAAGEGVGKLLSALIEAGDTIHDLQSKNFRLEQEKLGQNMLWLDLKRATALLAFHSVKFHEAEHPAVKRLVEKLADCENPYPSEPKNKPKTKAKS